MPVSGKRMRERLSALGHPADSGGQTWLAKKVGMGQQGIGAILAGDVRRPRLLREIAEALETSQEYLLEETDDPTPKDKLPKIVRDAIEQIPGGALTEDEARSVLEIVRLISLSRSSQNSDKKDTEPQRAS